MSDINVKRFKDKASGRRMVSITGALCPPRGSWLDQFKRSRDEVDFVQKLAEESMSEDDGPEIRRAKWAEAQKEFTKRKRREQLSLALDDCKEIRDAFLIPSPVSGRPWVEIGGFQVSMNLHKKPREMGHPWMFYKLLYIEPQDGPKSGEEA